jgi:hypothetical protein
MHVATIEGRCSVTDTDQQFMDYLDELYDTRPSFGMLLFKGDPIAFRLAREEWRASANFAKD